MSADLGFVHVFEPPRTPGAPVLLLLHGTGGDERDLLPLGRTLVPTAGLLSPRGKVSEQGMARFFRRLAEGVFDVADLRRRTLELADFVEQAAAHYGVEQNRVVAVGFSNGANIAASMLLLRPETLAAAVLFRAMMPLQPDPLPSIPGTPVFLASGTHDPLIPPREAERLATLLRAAGARVTPHWERAGHQLTPGDVAAARDWLASAAGVMGREQSAA
ncbi:MAG TPA: alpha/beta hydrolase [Candidatus Sulfotelmatobacter sp.]|nr:alpha/beta hydrolase [Candidatus Sulfotelmatobacter sp.]